MRTDEMQCFRLFCQIQAWGEVVLASGRNPKLTCIDKGVEQEWDEHLKKEAERKAQLTEIEEKLREISGLTDNSTRTGKDRC